MRKTIATMVAVAMLAIALPVIATQNEDIVEGWYTVAWEIPGPNHFPQNLFDYAAVKDLDFFDGNLDECKKYQVDVYRINSERDIELLVGLIKKGTLSLNKDGKPEDNKIWHSSKIVDAKDCTPEETTTTTSTTVQETTTTSTEDTTTTTTDDGSSTTLTAPSTTTPVTTPPTTPTELPFTGSDNGLKALIAGILGLVGIATLGLARRVHGQN